ncbi:MAG: LysR family transcriptional regulator [Pseudomonadota bacterium]
MNIETLKLFVDVAQRLSFAAVADDMDINPSSVSRAISSLEQQLNLRLFNRTTRKMTLTEAGEAYLKRIRHVVEEYEQATEHARLLNSEPMGTLRMTASVAFGEKVLSPLLAPFQARFPGVSLELLFTDTNVDLVSEGIDLAVRLGSKLSGDVVATKLFSTHYRVVASPKYLSRHPVGHRPQELQNHKCIVFTLPAYKNRWQFRHVDTPNAQPEVVTVNPNIAISSALTIRTMALMGGGPAILAGWLVDEDIEKGDLIDLFPHYQVAGNEFDTSAWLIYPDRAYLPKKVRVMIDFLKENLRSD